MRWRPVSNRAAINQHFPPSQGHAPLPLASRCRRRKHRACPLRPLPCLSALLLPCFLPLAKLYDQHARKLHKKRAKPNFDLEVSSLISPGQFRYMYKPYALILLLASHPPYRATVSPTRSSLPVVPRTTASTVATSLLLQPPLLLRLR